MSAQAAMAGLFPPNPSQKWNNNIDWQPVPVHAIPYDQDYVLAADKQCDHFDFIMLEYLNETIYGGLFNKYRPLINYLEKNAGQKLSTVTDLCNLYDVLLVEKMKGFWYVNKW